MSTASRVLASLVGALFSILPGLAGQGPPGSPGGAAGLLSLKRLCVEKFSGESTEGTRARELAIASLFASKRFSLHENCAKAEAILKGSVSLEREHRVRSESEGIDFSASASGSGDSGRSAAAAKGGTSERLFSAETGSQASVTLRIVDKDGEILWAHTEESRAGKVKSSLAQAVDHAVKQLLREIEKAQPKAK